MAGITVATIAFDGISPFHLSVPCLVFGEDHTGLGLPAFDFRVCALEARPLRAKGGMTLSTPYRLADAAGAEIVVVPSWDRLEDPVPPGLIQALKEAHAAGALIVGLCLGSFPVAAAGLLDGREATTHWGYSDRFRALYPKVLLRPDVLYVDHGDVVTSAGVAAGLDCCLHIVRARYGSEAALRLARRLVLSPHRQGGQAQFIERPVSRSDRPDAFTRAIEAARARISEPLSLDAMAERAAMSRRTFTRRFQMTFGMSFGNWLIEQRIMLAQRLLETTTKPIEEIAFESGFGTAASLRQHFAARLRTSPAQYRREFSRREGGTAPSATGPLP